MRTATLITFALSFAAPVLSENIIQIGKDLAAVQTAFYDANIPKALDVKFSPSLFLEVIYPQRNGPPIVVKPGQTLQVNQTAIAPMFAIGGSRDIRDDDSTYVITMFDPDAPSPSNPVAAPLRHFVGSDFIPITPGEFDLALLANTSHAMSPYIQPAPTAGSGPHRYTWLLWKQPKDFDNQTFFPPITSPAGLNISAVEKFDIPGFVKATGLGLPIGGSFALIGPPS